MAYLRLVSLSDDGSQLRLVDEEGAEHVLAVDDRLRAAVLPSATPATAATRGTEKKMESTLRPRDIQARIRAGESPEAVAQAAQTSVDKIMAFAAPVLAERQHVADRAQRSSVRRSEGQAAGGARTLGEAVASHLRSLNVDPTTVEWDSWRREDGRWSLVGVFETGDRSGTAELTYDAPGNFVVLDNEDSRWLVGEAVAAPEPPADDLRHARQRRLSSVHPDEQELPLGDDAIDLVSDSADSSDLGTEQPLEAFLDETPPTDPVVAAEQAELREEAADAAADEHAPAEQQEHEGEPPSRRPVKKTRGRASVPSWDEIMFGGGSSD